MTKNRTKSGDEQRDGVGNSPLHLACESGDLKNAAALIADGADIEAVNNALMTPIFAATSPACIDLMVAHGANLAHKSRECGSPLQWAVDRNKVDLAKALIEGGADANEVIDDSKYGAISLLDRALDYWEPQIADLLRHYGVGQRTALKLDLSEPYLRQVLAIYYSEAIDVDPNGAADELNNQGMPTPASEDKWDAAMVISVDERYYELYGEFT